MKSAASASEVPMRVGIVGGGLAGLAAAAVLVESGATVELFEARRHLGGRAGSYRDPQTGRLVDHCQHVAMGCCTYWLDFCRRMGIARQFRRHRKLHFFGPGGKGFGFAAARWLPAPLHLLPPLLGLGYLSLRERIGVARTLVRLATHQPPDEIDGSTIGDWLRLQRQSQTAIDRFWSVVLVSALGETVERASVAAARKVFVDGFLNHRQAYEVLVPTAPLSELYDHRVAESLCAGGANIRTGARVTRVVGDAQGVTRLLLADGEQRDFDHIILAVPWLQVSRLLPETVRGGLPQLDALGQIESSPITGVHLWFDQPITRLPHAVLVGRLSQWLFNHGQSPDVETRQPQGYYVQVVISGSRVLDGEPRPAILDAVLDDLRGSFSAVASAKLLRWQIVHQPHAVFSVRPGIDAIRPGQTTSVRGLHLAGDWTQTGWPATMEGAVRSGYRAAASVLKAAGQPAETDVPELPRGLVARFLLGSSIG
jgi:squalene-associated FAD-dependent desaturase